MEDSYAEYRQDKRRRRFGAVVASSLAQLRHLYGQMARGLVTDRVRAAEGILGPVIEDLERLDDARVADALGRLRALYAGMLSPRKDYGGEWLAATIREMERRFA